MDNAIRAGAGGTVVLCRVVPSASRSEIAGVSDDFVRIRLAAPPVDGKANAELVKFLSKFFKVPKGGVEILKGETGKLKTVLVSGVGLEEAKRKLKEAK
jgi:hypothetical protein